MILVDLYSHGESSDLRPHAFVDEDLENAKDIISLMRDQFKDSKYFVVGHSFGGRVAGLVAAQDSSHVAGAVLITPLPAKGNPFADAHKSALISGAKDYEIFVTIANAMTTVPPRPQRPLLPTFLKSWYADFTRSVNTHFAERILSGAKDRSSILFEGIRSPLLFITGDLDFMFTQTLAEVSQFKNTFVNLLSLPNYGHFVPIDNPVEVAKWINEFIHANK